MKTLPVLRLSLLSLLFGATVLRLAAATTFVSFQEGDLRVGTDPATVSSNGSVIDPAYNMRATFLRSDQPDAAQDNNPLQVGNNGATTNRALLAFNLAYLQTLVGTNLNLIESAALSLTHDVAGAGSSSIHAVYLTSPFDETTATWNNPHGGNTNAGGYIGTDLRERSCIGTSASPTRELWGSPATNWTDSGTGPDLLVDAVRGALTNANKTLYLMVKRKSESATAYFSRYQHDGDPDRDFRPELIVGLNPPPTEASNASVLTWYYFNESSNTAPSLAAVAAATVPHTNLWAANAAAGAGLGQFGYGGITGNTHGYGTGGFVSAPSGFYVRANVTASDEAGAIAAGDYLSFTLGPRLGSVLNITGLSAWFKLQATNTLSASIAVRSSLDGFTADLATFTIPGSSTTSFTLVTNALSGLAFGNLVNPVEFRFYFFDNMGNTADILRLDDVGFFGFTTNPPPSMQILTLAASDPTATESGADYGAFTLQRFGDASGALAVAYTISGTASNGVDYQFLSGATNFPPGVTNLVVPVIPIDDFRPESPETVILTLNASSAYVVAGTNAASVTITDDNDPPEFNVAATAPFALEDSAGLNATFTITRALGDTNAAVNVQFQFSGTALEGIDYSPSASGALLFGTGVVSRTITIIPIDDALAEGNESIVLNLLPGAGYSVDSSNSAVVTLFDDESITNASVLLEAEGFTNTGGWVVDQQFVDLMGSPYLLAHGKGHPVADATTIAQFPAPGTYRVWVRTKDWTAPSADHPGSFTVVAGGYGLAPVFGTSGQGWLWQDGGLVGINNPATEVRLHDLTGFDGRCDALFFTTDLAFVPPNSPADLAAWRRAQAGLPVTPPSAGNFDLVVVGGGIAGSAAAIAAARQGLQVSLVHDRPYPGGNASRDVRVHTLGVPLNGIVNEINTPDYLIGSDEFIQSDEHRLQVLLGETNLHLFTEWRAFAANTNGPHITSIDAKQTHTGQQLRFSAPVFIDSTGDGCIGYWAGALYREGREAGQEFNESLAPANADGVTQGTTISWNSRNTGQPVTFPSVPWATNVAKDYVAAEGDWWWEYGLTRDTIYDAEEIRDHLLQAIYGSFFNLKHNGAYANQDLDWVGYIAGKRESRRLVGDYLLTESDVRNHPVFPDAVITESREIDIHYPLPGIYDFFTDAQYTSISSYWIPFRCLYSTNIDNLMMAGRCLSATHVGLGSPRVMNTGGQMGVATGTAAALCKLYATNPRGVWQHHIDELRALMGLTQFSASPTNTVSLIDNQDTRHVELTGAWTSSTSVSGYYGADYIHDGNTNKGAKSVCFRPEVPLPGRYKVYLRWTAGSNRANNVPVDINGNDGTHTVTVDQTVDPAGWFLLGSFPFDLGTVGSIVVRTTGTTGYVIADAIALAADFSIDPRFVGRPWEDADADGVCNYVEWLHGTDPQDPKSCLSVRLARAVGARELRFVALAGKSYSIQYRESLSFGSWLKLSDLEASNLTYEAQIADPLPPANTARFYRLVTPKLQ